MGWRRATAMAVVLVGWLGCDPAPAPEPLELPDTVIAKDTLPAVKDTDGAEVDKDAVWPLDANPPQPVPPPFAASCTTAWTFALPQLPEPTGDIGMETGSAMSAVGQEEQLFIYVILPGKSTLDTAATGPLQLSVDAGTEVLSVTNAVKGIGSALLRFQTEGPHPITVTFGDGRTGTATVYAYTTQLPVWHITLADGMWQAMKANPYLKKEYPCTLRIGDTQYLEATIRLRGGSSVDLPKKSFHIKLKNGSALPNGHDNLILRGEYIDKTLMRTWLGYDAFRQATWLPAPATAFVHLRINQSFYGVLQSVEHIDGNFLKLRNRDPNGALYEGDPPHDISALGANFTPLAKTDQYKVLYQKHEGPKSYADLIAFVEDVLQRQDGVLFATLEQHLKVRDWIEYAALMAVLQNREHIRKNWYMYRNFSAADDRFELLAWDLDVTWGHLWSEQLDILDEAIITDLPADVGRFALDNKFYNQLYRVLDNPAWRKLWAQRVLALADVVLDDAFLQPRLSYLQCLLTPDLLADQRKRSTNAEFVQRVGEISTFAKARRQFLHQSLETP